MAAAATSKWGRRAGFLALAATALVVFFPIYWMLMTATMPTSLILARQPALLPHPDQFSLDAFWGALARKPFLLWTLNSLIIAVASSAVSLFVAILAGYSLSRWNFASQRLLAASLMLGKILPASLVIIPFFVMFSVGGLLDSYGALVLANVSTGVPLAAFLMKQFFDRVPRELDEAAMLDGCSRLTTLGRVVLPLVKPGLASCSVYLLLMSWSEFLFARTLISDVNKRVLTVGLQSFAGEYLVDWPALMAAATLTLVPIIILFIFLEPFLVSGATSGAISK